MNRSRLIIWGAVCVLVLAGANLAQTRKVADKLRKRVGQTKWSVRQSAGIFNRGENIRVTVSGGVAEFRADDSPESILNRADQALYLAKDAGRNAVRTETDLEKVET